MFLGKVCVHLLAIAAYAVPTAAQLPPYRSSATILSDACLPQNAIANQTADQETANILRTVAAEMANGSRSKGCLDKIYVMAYTGSTSRSAGSYHSHNFEVVAAGQTRHIVLPDRPGDYTQHQGDIWKLDMFEDLGFLTGTCVRLCNIESVSLREGGTDGWLVDSVMTYGCIDNMGCNLLTQDVDVHRWLDGNGFGDVMEIPLTIVTRTSCVY